MAYETLTKAKDLNAWAETLESRYKLPALVRKLIHATELNPRLVQFPADEGVQRRGWDGVVEADSGNAWIPNGKSVWEMGVGQNPETKANGDYAKRTEKPGPLRLTETTFVFVTPRKWESKTTWIQDKRGENAWLNVRAYDSDDLEQWLEMAPAVDAWLARLMGQVPAGVYDLSSYWQNLAGTSNPPLRPAVFLAGRAKTEKELREAVAGPPAEVGISAESLGELLDFAAAVLANGDEVAKSAVTARALIVDAVDAWSQLSTTKNRLLLIPSARLPLDRPMVAEAVRAGHHVLTKRPYTVVRSSDDIRLPRADRFELQKALEAGGFAEERAGQLAREAGGSLCVFVRLASQFVGHAVPDWSKPNEAAALVPLVLVGSWSDRNAEDRKLIERTFQTLGGRCQETLSIN
jgi:hypothetical protein